MVFRIYLYKGGLCAQVDEHSTEHARLLEEGWTTTKYFVDPAAAAGQRALDALPPDAVPKTPAARKVVSEGTDIAAQCLKQLGKMREACAPFMAICELGAFDRHAIVIAEAESPEDIAKTTESAQMFLEKICHSVYQLSLAEVASANPWK